MKPTFKFKPLAILATVVGVAYPFAVYFGLQVSTPLVICFCLLAFLAIRILLKWREKKETIELFALGLTFICVIGLLGFDQLLAVKAYPVALSLSLCAVFTYSLIHPPTMIERFARLVEPDLNDKGVRYTRNVTIIWIAFFVCNACASLATALWGTLEVWTFYNGFLSYICVGALMGGEFIVRQFVKKHHRGDVS